MAYRYGNHNQMTLLPNLAKPEPKRGWISYAKLSLTHVCSGSARL
ncbi:MAG: hypothetical protein ACE5GV_11250 [Candidatus Scalindua sp.]